MIRLAALVLAVLTAAPVADDHDLRLVYVGRDAVFVDARTVKRDGATFTFRSLRVQEETFVAGGVRFKGGWSEMVLNCEGRTVAATAFQSLREDGTTGPLSPAREDLVTIPGGSAEQGMARLLCDRVAPWPYHLRTVDDAVRIGRARLANIDSEPRLTFAGATVGDPDTLYWVYQPVTRSGSKRTFRVMKVTGGIAPAGRDNITRQTVNRTVDCAVRRQTPENALYADLLCKAAGGAEAFSLRTPDQAFLFSEEMIEGQRTDRLFDRDPSRRD